jgi:CubicO group peptidase (beta-lactamase class C family)
LHTLQSVTKVVTATLIARLENEKKINITNPVETYLPELKGTAWQGISVKDILYMQSGMEGAETVAGTRPFTDTNNLHYQFEAALDVVPRTSATFSSVYKYIANLKRSWTPGEKTEYNSINTFVLGWIAERITNKTYADLVTDMIWKPMGASSNAYVCLSGNGIAVGNSGMSTTLTDLARFGVLYTKKNIASRQGKIISYDQVRKIQVAGELGYQWEWAEVGGGIQKTGFGGQGLYVNPEKNIVIAYFNFVNEDWKDPAFLPILQQVEKVISAKEKF